MIHSERSLSDTTTWVWREMEDYLNPEELLSISEFQKSGDTEGLLAPDLTNLSQYWYR